MAVIVTPKSSDHSSLAKFLSKFRPKRVSKEKESQQLPQDPKLPLNFTPLPLVLPQHQQILSQLGWTTLTFPTAETASFPDGSTPGPHPLQRAYLDLFAAAQRFFDSPDEEKTQWKHRLGSEEGWSKIPGEKEFITLRTLAYTPDVLKAPAKRYWDLMGFTLASTLGRISASLGLPDDDDEGLRRFVGPCKKMGDKEEDKTSTMLRIFRYEGWESKVVAEAHADLGLLSCVVGDVPGLEVWNGQQFVDIERHYVGPCATMLVGRQLERYSNFRYPAGGHRVVSYGPPPTEVTPQSQEEGKRKKFRHSIVFVLRAHEPVMVNSDELETEITGKWKVPVKDITAGEMYDEIRRRHFNVNTSMDERNKQKQKLREKGNSGRGRPIEKEKATG